MTDVSVEHRACQEVLVERERERRDTHLHVWMNRLF